MATVPSPRTWTVGELLTAAKMNTDVRDGLNFLLSTKPLARLTRTSSTTIGNTNIAWDAETLDRDNGHSTSSNNDRYVVKTAGWYRALAFIEIVDAFTANEVRKLRISHISSAGSLLDYMSQSVHSSGQGNNTEITTTAMFPMAVNDYMTVTFLLQSGTELIGGDCRFIIEWISSTP